MDFGKTLDIDLSDERILTYNLSEELVTKFLGGEGIAAWLYWKNRVGGSALSLDNVLVFATGPLTGIAPGAGRTVVAGKSPMSVPESFTTSSFGGEWGAELRFAGYDILIIRGKTETPVYLWINDDEVEIRSAKHLWGKGTLKVRELLTKELNDEEVKVLTIGPAGERQSRFASIIHRSGHAAGQGGFGAVMGSKNLKAIVIRGLRRSLKVSNPNLFFEEAERVKKMAHHLSIVSQFSPVYKAYVELSVAPLPEDLIPITRKYMKKRTGCHGCPKSCHVYIELPEKNIKGEMSCVQFFFCWFQQGYKGYADEACFLAKHLADELGLNCYELMQLIPLLMALYEKGILPKDVGIPFEKYPEEEFLEALLNKIALREGIGDLLAEGTWRFAEKLGVLEKYLSLSDDMEDVIVKYWGPVAGASGYGPGVRGYCNHYDPRDYVVSALLWATSHRDPWSFSHEYVAVVHWSGLDLEQQRALSKYAWGSEDAVHVLGSPSYSVEEVKAAIIIQNRSCVKNSLILCDWLYPMVTSPDVSRNYFGDIELVSRLTNAVLGSNFTEQDLQFIGERIFNLERAILLREGAGDILLPEHLLTHSQKFTLSPPIDKDKFKAMLKTYFELRGWSDKGVPTKEKLFQVGLDEVVKFLQEAGLHEK